MLFNSVSFGAVLLSFPFIHPYPVDRQPIKDKNVLRNISEGLKFIYNRKVMFGTLLVMAITGTFVMNENVLVPVFSEQVLHQHQTGFGFLISMIGIGTLTGAFTMASMAKKGPRKFTVYGFPVITGVLLVLVGFTDIFAVTGIALLLLGFGFLMFSTSARHSKLDSALAITESKKLYGILSAFQQATKPGADSETSCHKPAKKHKEVNLHRFDLFIAGGQSSFKNDMALRPTPYERFPQARPFPPGCCKCTQ